MKQLSIEFSTLHLLVASIGGGKGDLRVLTKVLVKETLALVFIASGFKAFLPYWRFHSTRFKKLFLFLKRYVDPIRGNADRLQ